MSLQFKRIVFIAAALLVALTVLPHLASAQSKTTTVTVLGFADYHSHAVPFYSEGAANQAGIARAIAYLKAQHLADPNLLVLNGGDMLNITTPTWSDEYKCLEWPWFNGLVDAMALGNHDLDYGTDAFNKCVADVSYPVLSANYVDADGKALLNGGKTYFIKTFGDIKIGTFALAGSDFNSLIKKENRVANSSFADRIAAAKQVVSALRDTEKVNAVIFFGHESREDDIALAQAVPGIDLILGSHSHYKSDFIKLPNTNTYFVSPFQYLTYFDRAEITFTDGKISAMTGQLVKMDALQLEDPAIQGLVLQKRKDLEAAHPDRFKVLGTAAVELSDARISTDEAVVGNWAMDAVRVAAGTQVFFSTSSSFRAAIPPGPITVEAFYTAIPYKNAIATADMTGQQVIDLLNLIISKRGSDNFCQESGIRFKIQDGKATDIQILTDPADATKFAAIDPTKTYKIGTTDFQATVSGVYKDTFAKAANLVNTKVDIQTLLIAKIQADGTISAALDGRMGTPPTAPAAATTAPTAAATKAS